jgi:hypothetical protein
MEKRTPPGIQVPEMDDRLFRNERKEWQPTIIGSGLHPDP